MRVIESNSSEDDYGRLTRVLFAINPDRTDSVRTVDLERCFNSAEINKLIDYLIADYDIDERDLI